MDNKNISTTLSSSDTIKKMVFASLFATMIAIGAHISIPIPFSPVPSTLQTFFVFIAGAMLGIKWGSISVIIYIFIGIVGFPVFAGGTSGFGVLIGPTGGYIIGFIFAAAIIGALCEKKGTSNILFNILFMAVGLFTVYLFGIPQLMLIADISFSKAIAVGMVPFLMGGLVEIIVASFIVKKFPILHD